jgi:hypothetical protein
MNAAEAVFSAPPSGEVIAGAAPEGAGVAVGEGLGTGARVAEGRVRGVGMGLVVPPTPPQPPKENTMRDKQINEEIPKTQNERWRRIDYLSAIKGEQLWGVQSWIIINWPKMSIGLTRIRFLLSGP